jgi:hypothetical protein
MARIDWSVICDLAYFDATGRLCLLGVETECAVPRLPVGMQRFSIVARVQDGWISDAAAPVLSVTSPRGEWRAIAADREFLVEQRAEYVIVHLPGLRLIDEGLYRFELALAAPDLATVELSALVTAHQPTRIHRHGAH